MKCVYYNVCKLGSAVLAACVQFVFVSFNCVGFEVVFF